MSTVNNDEYTHGQDIYLVNGEGSTSWKFGCYTLCGEMCILLSCSGSHMTMPILGITAIPPKTDEQILRDELITWIYSDINLGAYDDNQEATLVIDSLLNSGKFKVEAIE